MLTEAENAETRVETGFASEQRTLTDFTQEIR